jgi:cytochrome c peroxidase
MRGPVSSVGGASVAAMLMLLAMAGGAFSAEPAGAGGYQWNLTRGFPKPYVAAGNPMSEAKVELGRYLFYDPRMSINGKQSCASCHKQELAFADGRAVGLGTTGESHSRGAMSLVNVAWNGSLTWSNPEMKSLEKQALVPMFGDHPIELGMRDDGGFLRVMQSDATYRPLFERAFPDTGDAFTISSVTKAFASFERSIVSARSP